uniref:hypothetical protein n=1 Tax=Escherichia coli TaxID=562 RepID=UPI0032B56FF3
SGPKTSIICSPMTSLKTSIKTITYLSDTGCLEIQGASLLPSPGSFPWGVEHIMIYKISGNQRLIWKFYKTDDNKWRWYCHEKNGYLLSQSDNAYNSQLLCIENAKKQ